VALRRLVVFRFIAPRAGRSGPIAIAGVRAAARGAPDGLRRPSRYPAERDFIAGGLTPSRSDAVGCCGKWHRHKPCVAGLFLSSNPSGLLAAAKAAVAVAMSTKSRESFWPQISAEGAREAARKARVINRRTAIARPSRRFHELANINALGSPACAQRATPCSPISTGTRKIRCSSAAPLGEKRSCSKPTPCTQHRARLLKAYLESGR
jgi:hypothetical protein